MELFKYTITYHNLVGSVQPTPLCSPTNEMIAATAIIVLASIAGVSEGFIALSPSQWSAGTNSANGVSASSADAIRPRSVRMTMSSVAGSASAASWQTFDLQSWAKVGLGRGIGG